MIGNVIGSWRIVAELGEGGAGEVFFAEHQVIGRRAAIKFLRPELSADNGMVSRFISEAKAVNGIRHPNIVDITDFGDYEDRKYLVMELLEGETVAERLERVGSFQQKEAAEVTRQVASALSAAHEFGFVHRDIKPENLFLTNHPDQPHFIKVLDFGIAKLLDSATKKDFATSNHTTMGTFMGTPYYMSPEQCMGKAELDGRADVYSLGIVLYEMVCGNVPFQGDTLGKIILAHNMESPPPPIDLVPDVSEEMNRIILKSLQKKPEDRFETMQGFRDALLEFLQPKAEPPPEAPPEEAEEEEVSQATVQPKVIKFPSQLASPVAPSSTAQEAEGATGAEEEEVASEEEVEQIVQARSERVAGTLTQIIVKRIRANSLTLPAMPDVVVKGLEELNNPNHNFQALAAILGRDPLITSQVLRLANSVAFATLDKARTLDQAISRVGDRHIKSLLFKLSARKVFESKNSKIREALSGIWDHSLATGILCRELYIASEQHQAPDMAYLAGLLHDTGKPITAGILLEAERQLIKKESDFLDYDMWMRVIAESHLEVGIAVAKAWLMPEEVVDAIANCQEFDFEDSRRLANVVCFANTLAKLNATYPGTVDLEHLHTLKQKGCELFELSEEVVDDLVEALPEQMESEG